MDAARAPDTSLEFLETATRHLTADVPVLPPTATVDEARAFLVGRRYEVASDVAVCDDGRLVGMLGVEQLLAADGDAAVADVMDGSPPVVGPGLDQEHVAWRMAHEQARCLGVVDEDGRFCGLVPPQPMLAVLLAEHEEDLARIGGYLATTSGARSASEEPVGRRLLHRLPWLLIGLIGAMASAAIVGGFESTLEVKVLLAFFLPGVVYMADAVGTQTETLVIRGMSVGVSVREVVGRELLTGAVIGVLVAVAFVPFTLLVWGDLAVALAVGVALFASCGVASVIAMLLPALFHRFGVDPAFGSGPLATVVQDLLSIVIYFLVVTWIAA